MGTTSTVNGLPAPADGDGNDFVADMLALVAVLDGGSVVKRLTSTQIGALSAGQMPAGLVVYNTTTSKLQISNGVVWADVPTVPEWVAYTPSLTADTTNPNIGTTGTIVGRWARIGSTIFWRAVITTGGTGVSAGSGTYHVSLPATPAAAYQPLGTGLTWTASTVPFVAVYDGSVMAMIGPTGAVGSACGGFSTAGQAIALGGSYEAA